MRTRTRVTQMGLLGLLCFALMGCEQNSPETLSGPPTQSPLLTPFAGQWQFQFEKTLAAQQAAGIPEEQIAQTRKFFADHPQLPPMHPNLTITGHVAVGSDKTPSEYRFFAMHQHDAQVCGKAWHHEDRFDPGDMSKCWVRLWLADGDLHLQVHMEDGWPDDNDPDFGVDSPVEGDVSKCDAAKQNQKPEAWRTYVFSRR